MKISAVLHALMIGFKVHKGACIVMICHYRLKLSIGFFLSFDNIDDKVKNLVKIDLSDKIR